MLNELAHPPILTVAEVACHLRVSETTIWRWCSSGKLPAFRVGRSWRVRRGDLDAIVEGTQQSRATESLSSAHDPQVS